MGKAKKRFVLLPQDHTVMVRQTSKWGQIFLMSLIGLGATAFATAWIYRIDEVVTVNGRLVPKNGGVEVKSPLNGKLNSILIDNGERVVKGQKLLQFDVKSAKAEKETINKQLDLERQNLEDELKSLKRRKITLKRNIELTETLLNKLLYLEEKGAISEVQILQQNNRLQQQRDELIQLQMSEKKTNNSSKSRIASLNGKLQLIDNQLENEWVKSPLSGTVFDLKPDNDKYVTQNAEPLLKVVPTGELDAEVNIGNSDIGFIKVGQDVEVRVDSFPFTEYGDLDGSISDIGADSLPPNEIVGSYHFPVMIDLENSNLKTKDGLIIQLQSGMTVTCNIKLRDRRLIELLSELFTDRSESLERLRQP